MVENVNNNKQDLVDRVENVQNVIDYNKLLTELENKTNSSTNKDELNSARDYNTSTELANKLASLNDDANKEKLLNRYNALLPKLNDTTAPVVSGLDKKYTNQIVKLTITDDSSFSATLNGKNYVSGNEIKEDGVYNLVAVDASFNETVVTFTIDTTLPKTSAANILINRDSNNDKVFYGTYGDKIYTYVRFSEELKQIPTFKLINNGKEYVIDEKDITITKNDNGEYQYSAYVELTEELGMTDGEITMLVSNIEDKAGNKIDDITKPTNGHIVYLDTTPAGRVYSTLDFDGTGIVPEIDGTRRTYYIKNGSSFVFRMQFTEQLSENPILNVDNKQVELELVDKYVTEEGKYIYQGKVEINADDNFKDGILVLILSNVKDLAGNETTDIEVLDQTVTSNDRTAFIDNTAPEITIAGTEGLNKNEYRIESGTSITLEDMLAIASDASFAKDIKIEPKKVDFLAPGSVLENNIYNYDYKTNGFDTRKVGRYNIYYQATDKAGNVSEEKLMMLVMTDTTAPVVTINGKTDIYVEFGSKYNELGATMTDNVDATITDLKPTTIVLYDLNGNHIKDVTTTGVDTNVEGRYLLYYDYVDGAGNSSKTDNGYTPYQAKRWVIVQDTKAPNTTAANIKIKDESNDKKEYFAKNGDVISVYVRFNEQLKYKPTFKLINNGREYVFDESNITIRSFENGEYQYSVDYKITEDNGMTDGEITMHVSNIEDLYGNKAEDIIKPTNDHIVYLDNTLKHKTLGIGKNGNPDTVSQYVKNGDSIRVLIYFDEELAVLPKVKIKGIEYDTHFAPDSSNPEIGNYAYHLDLDITEDLGLDEGLITFEVYGYEDKAGNKVSEPLTNEDITYTNRLSAVYYDKTDVEAKLLYILARDDADYRLSISDGEYLRVEANFDEELKELPILTVGSQSMEFDRCKFNSTNNLYVCVADMKIDNEIAKLQEGEIIPFTISNVKDLAGNETSFNNDDVTRYYQGGKLVYDQVKYENTFVSMTFHNNTNYKLNQINGNDDLSLTEAKIGDTVRVFIRFNQNIDIVNFKPIISLGGISKELNLANTYSDGTKDYGADIKITEEMNLQANKEISFVINNIVLENGNRLPQLTQNNITSNILSGVTFITD